VNAGFVRATRNPSPPVDLGLGRAVARLPTLLLAITPTIGGVLIALRPQGAILLARVGGTVLRAIATLGWPESELGFEFSGAIMSVPDLSVIGSVDFGFDVAKVSVVALVMFVFTLVFSNFFDAMGTMTGLAKEADLADEKGDFPR